MEEIRLAEFIGIMLGDGYIGIYDFTQHNRKKILYQLKVTLNSKDIQYINYIFKLMKEVFGIEPKVFF